jgi:hypothetical protein
MVKSTKQKFKSYPTWSEMICWSFSILA